jgi:Leucine-rich repeat (LRR) protein
MLTNTIITNLQDLLSTLNRPTTSTIEVRAGEGRIVSQASNFAQLQNFIYGRIIPLAVSITLLAVSCHLISTSGITLPIPSAVIGMGGLAAVLLTRAIVSWYRREAATLPALIPLHGYHQKLSIIAPSSLPDFDTQVASLPAELIDMIQAFCSDKDLLALTSVNQAALATRFCNPRLQKLSFKTVKDTEQFLSYCQASQKKAAQALLEQGTISHQQLKPALSSSPHFPLFTQEHVQELTALTLTLSAQFTAEQYDLLFTYLPEIQHLTIYSEGDNHGNLGTLCKAAQRLSLQHLAIIYSDSNPDKFENNLPDELWQLTTLKTLTIKGGTNVVSIPEDIGRLNALKSLTLQNMPKLETLPASLGQLDKLEALTLRMLDRLTALPEEIGQLNALKSLELRDMPLRALPASIGQLNQLEALILEKLTRLIALPEEIGQLNALKSLELNKLRVKALPASLGQLDKLTALILYGLPLITEVPEEIGQLNALKLLRLEGINNLKALPASLGQLDKLEALTLIYMPLVATLPEEIGQLKVLKSLTLACLRLEALPASIGQLDQLETLSLSDLGLIALPEEIGQLDKLETLVLESLYPLQTIPESIGQLKGLKVVKLISMSHLVELPREIVQVTVREKRAF